MTAVTRTYLSFASISLAAATAAVCAYYLATGLGYSSGLNTGTALTHSANLAWVARVSAAAALEHATLWARGSIVLGIVSLSTFPFARLGGRSLLERAGLVSRDWRKAASSWAFVLSCTLLALVAFLNFYANAATWAIRSESLQLILFLGLSPLNSVVSDPIGPLGGVGEIAKWFAIFLVLTVVSFFSLRVRLGVRNALFDSAVVLLGCLLLYEFGLVLLCSNYDNAWVTALQIGTPIQWFSNMDLLYLSASGVAVLTASRMAIKSAGRPAQA